MSSKWTDPQLLLPFHDQLQVERELATHRKHQLDALEVHPHLALVVDRPAPVEVAVANLRLERGRPPLLERVNGLHVVVAVDERGRELRVDDSLGVDGRMARRLHDLGMLEAGSAGRVGEVFGVAADVGRMGGIRRDAGDAEELDELVHMALLVGGTVGVEVVLRHAGSLVWRPLRLHQV